MKIGIILSRFPYPLEKGDKLRAYYQIKELAKRHEIYLCAINVGKIKPEALEIISPYCRKIKIIRLNRFTILLNLIYGLLFTNLPLQIAFFFKRSKKKEVQDFFVEAQVDHLICQLIRSSEYVKELNQFPKTLDYMDALSQGMQRRIVKSPFYLRPFVKIEALRLKSYEHFIFRYFQYKTIISEQDRDLIVHAENQKIEIIPNGVDQRFFSPQDVPKKYDLIFTGNMSYPPNVEGAGYIVNQILPLLKDDFPELKLAIVGANPSPKVRRLASSRVFVSGWVDDIRDYYAAAKVFVAPMLIGTGLQNKLLEAMAMKIPCITTELANNALNASPKKNILIANCPEDFARLIRTLLNKTELAEEIALQGQEFVKNNYDWKICVEKLERLISNHPPGK